jgi:hypothetical protein
VVQAYIEERLAELLSQAEATVQTILREEQGVPEEVEKEQTLDAAEAAERAEASKTWTTDCRDKVTGKNTSITSTEEPESDIGPQRPRYSYQEIIEYFDAVVSPTRAEIFNCPELFAAASAEHILKLILIPHDGNPQWDPENMFITSHNLRILPKYAYNFELMKKVAVKGGVFGHKGMFLTMELRRERCQQTACSAESR